MGWLVTPWIEGESGADWLDDPERARQLAHAMGRLAKRLRTVDLGGHPADAGPADRAPIDSGSPWVGHAPQTPTPDAVTRRGFVHGDFAPVNVVMTPDGEIAALLDFEHAGFGPGLLDVAWWGWVVRHHHPDAWTAAWPTFLTAAGLHPGVHDQELHDLVLGILAARTRGSPDAAGRARWQQRMESARAWTVGRDQAT